jgi:PEGA domain
MSIAASRASRVITRAVIIGACLSASHAWATSPAQATPVPLAESLKGEAKAAYQSGLLVFNDGDSLGALEKFKHAYEVARDPRLLWNMAVCEKELRHYARAASLVQTFLKESGTRLTAEQRQSAVETQNALRAFYSRVTLSNAPDGATVSVDGTVVGSTPLTEPLLLDLGSRKLRVEQPGFEPFETQLDVPGASELTVPVSLRRAVIVSAPARLSVTTSGERDIVSVDGKVVGSQRWEGQLSIGEHVVRVTAAGKKPYESHVQLTAGSTRSLQVSLENDTHGMPAWAWVAGGAAVVAGAAVGGYFLFKPDGTNPGAHPEGKLSTVYFSLRTAAR